MKIPRGIKLFIPAQQLEEQSSKQGRVIFQMLPFCNFVNNISIIQYCINFIVSLCNHYNLSTIIDIIRYNNCFDELRFFIGRFKIESVAGMINKKVFAQFIYKPAYGNEKLFAQKNVDIYYSIYVEERGWVKVQLKAN